MEEQKSSPDGQNPDGQNHQSLGANRRHVQLPRWQGLRWDWSLRLRLHRSPPLPHSMFFPRLRLLGWLSCPFPRCILLYIKQEGEKFQSQAIPLTHHLPPPLKGLSSEHFFRCFSAVRYSSVENSVSSVADLDIAVS